MLTAKIRNVLNDLTETEQRLAEFLLSNPEKVVHMSAKDFACECDTVASAVIRLCKSLELDGFRKLKILLAEELGGRTGAGPLPALQKGDTPETVFKKVFGTGISTLKNTLGLMDFSSVAEIVEKIAAADRLYIFGVGTSSVVAEDASYRFAQLGVQAYSYTDILHMNVMAMNMHKGDVALCISHSGTTKAVVDAMRHAKAAGAATVALTSFTKSILYKECDLGVSVFADEENYPIEAVSARMAHMCVIDALVMTLASIKPDGLKEHIAMRNKALGEIRY